VRDCYDLLDLSPAGGVEDFTEGIYESDPDRSYLEAQRLKNEYLLDEVECRQGSRILDIGCGYGTLLEAARRRGAAGGGDHHLRTATETMPGQRARRAPDELPEHPAGMGQPLRRHRRQRLDRTLRPGSGSGRRLQLHVYREFFETCHRILSSGSRKLVTTVIVSSGRPALRPPCSGKSGAVTASAHRPRRNLEGGA
jgi:cyclopropane-fatty-acyl-phospholipid synthase